MQAEVEVFQARVVKRCRLSDRAFEIGLTRPCSFLFKPGQRVRFIRHGIERDYSLVSLPQDPVMALCVAHVEGGIFSGLLASAAMGDQFAFTGPHGHFLFRPSARKPVFVATGTGIAPFVSMARSGIQGFILLHGVSTPSELYYGPVFQSMAGQYVPCLSKGERDSQAAAAFFHGRVTGYMESRLAPGTYDFYLAGRGDMIRDVILLVDERFPGSLVYTETFY